MMAEDAVWCMAELGARVGDRAAFMIARAGAAAANQTPPSSASPPPRVLNLGPARSRFWEAAGLALGQELDQQTRTGIMAMDEAADAANAMSDFLIRQAQLALTRPPVRPQPGSPEIRAGRERPA